MLMSHLRAHGFDHLPLTLLVDEDPDTRRMYAEYLTLSTGCDVLEAEDGRDALAKALTRHPDVIVTETRLPGLSGFDLCALLRRDSSTSAIPIIFVTADALEADIRRAKRAGADAVLTKPCLPEQLLVEIAHVLEHSHALRSGRAAAHDAAVRQIERSSALLTRSTEQAKRLKLSRVHQRHETTTPPLPPPTLVCPECDSPLQYQLSYVGGVSARHAEQWDYYECSNGCGSFQYRERTRKLRKV
jgi:twitching motility two-component system response regulator PilH